MLGHHTGGDFKQNKNWHFSDKNFYNNDNDPLESFIVSKLLIKTIIICPVQVNNDYDVYYVRIDLIYSSKLTENLENIQLAQFPLH